MKARFNIQEIDSKAITALLSLESYVGKTALPKRYKELIKIRASQINGCAYCIEMHTSEARKDGEKESRIYALSAWRESPLFSDEERALLALTEEVTRIGDGGLSDATYAELQQHFSEEAIAQALMQVITINAWNRLAVASRTVHPHQVA